MQRTPTLGKAARKWLPCLFLLAVIKCPWIPYQPSAHYLTENKEVRPYFSPTRVSIEQLMHAQRTELGLGGESVDLKMSQEMGQDLSIALFGGFRAITASLLWVQAHKQWEEERTYKIQLLFKIIGILQPKVIFFWDTAAWHMAWNISYIELRRCEKQDKKMNQAECVHNHEAWIDSGRKHLETGLAYNPNSWDLYFKLGWLISERQPDRVGEAIPYYLAASEFPEAPRYIARQVGFAQETSGKFEDAYQTWLRLWSEYLQNHNPDEVAAVIWRKGREMEDHLQIPASQRIFYKISEAKMIEISRSL